MRRAKISLPKGLRHKTNQKKGERQKRFKTTQDAGE